MGCLRKIAALFLSVAGLIGCSSPSSTLIANPTSPLPITATSTPSNTPSPTLTASQTPSPPPTPTPTDLPFFEYDVISILEGHTTDYPNVIVFSEANDLLAVSGFYSDRVLIWNYLTGEISHVLDVSVRPIMGLAFSLDGKYAVTASAGNSQLEIWEINSEEIVGVIPIAQEVVNWPTTLEFLDDHTLGFVHGKSIEIFSFPDGKRLNSISADVLYFASGDFSDDGKLVAATSYFDNRVFVWDIETGELILEKDQEDGREDGFFRYLNLTQVQFSRDGLSIAVSFRELINIWDIEEGVIKATLKADSNEGELIDVIIYSPNGRQLIASTDVQGFLGSGRIYVWDIETSESIVSLRHSFEGQLLNPYIAMSPNGEYIAAGTVRSTKVYLFGSNLDLAPIVYDSRPRDPFPTLDLSILPYKEDFEDNQAQGFEFYSSTWSIGEEAGNHFLVLTGPNDYPQAWNNTSASWTDYVLETRMRIIRGGLFICVRANGEDFYNVFVNSESDEIMFAEFKNGNYETFGGDSFTAKANTWYAVRFEVMGNELSFYIDDELILSSTSDALSSGGFGFYIGGGDEVNLDDIEVFDLN